MERSFRNCWTNWRIERYPCFLLVSACETNDPTEPTGAEDQTHHRGSQRRGDLDPDSGGGAETETRSSLRKGIDRWNSAGRSSTLPLQGEVRDPLTRDSVTMIHDQLIIVQTQLPYDTHLPLKRQNLPERLIPRVQHQDPGVPTISYKQGIQGWGEDHTMCVTLHTLYLLLHLPHYLLTLTGHSSDDGGYAADHNEPVDRDVADGEAGLHTCLNAFLDSEWYSGAVQLQDGERTPDTVHHIHLPLISPAHHSWIMIGISTTEYHRYITIFHIHLSDHLTLPTADVQHLRIPSSSTENVHGCVSMVFTGDGDRF